MVVNNRDAASTCSTYSTAVSASKINNKAPQIDWFQEEPNSQKLEHFIAMICLKMIDAYALFSFES